MTNCAVSAGPRRTASRVAGTLFYALLLAAGIAAAHPEDEIVMPGEHGLDPAPCAALAELNNAEGSVTRKELALAASGVIAPSPALVEPLIAFTIAFVAIVNLIFPDMTGWRSALPGSGSVGTRLL